MRILVTGGSGFLGSAFTRAASAGGHSVAVLSRSASGAPDPRITSLLGDIASPPWDAIERFEPDTFVHLAWIATPGVYLESPENHDWVRWSADFFSRLPAVGVRRTVAVGTCIEYQVTGRPSREDETPISPSSTYARCKHELHGRLREASAANGVPLAWARVFYPYGEGEHPARLASSLVAKFRAGEAVTLKTPGSIKDYIHADDVASALLAVSACGSDGTVNIGTGEWVAVGSVARQIAELVGRPDLLRMPERPVADPLDYVVADAGRLRSLGWRPQVTLVSGLRRLVDAAPR